MAITTTESAGAREWTARPNRSLNPDTRRALICAFLAASLVISFGFSLAGAWPVLPFAGLEIGVLCLALRHLERKDQSFESVRLDGGRLIVTRRFPGDASCQIFPAGWARIGLEPDPPDSALVCIRAHGRSARVGRLMTPDQRRWLAADIRHSLQP